MRTWVDLNPPKDFDPRLVEMFKRINLYMKQSNTAFAKLGRGETPDGSSAPITDLTDYFKLSGRSGGQRAHGDRNAGGKLTLSSTFSTSKGTIYLGSDEATAAYDETNGLLGVGTIVPQARVHAVARQGAGTTLTPVNTNTNTNWAGPYTGAGGSPGSGTYAANLAANDGDGGYIGILASPVNGTNPQIVGLSGTVTVGQVWLVTLSLRTFSGTLGAGSQVTVTLVDSAGNSFTPSAQSLVGLGSSWTTYVISVDASGAPGGSGTANTVHISGSGGTSYLLMSYVAVDLDVTGTYADAMIAQAVTGSSGQNVLSVLDASGDSLFRVLDSGQVSFDDAGTQRAYFRPTGKLYISQPDLGTPYSDDPLIEMKTAATATNLTDYIRCLDNADVTVFSVGSDGGVNTASLNVLDTPGGGTSAATFRAIAGGTWGGSFTVDIPDASGTGVGTLALQSDSGRTAAMILGLTTTLKASSASSGVSFQDNTTSTKRLRVSLSGAVGNNSFTLTNSAARNYGFGNLSGNVVVVGDDPPAVASGALGKVDLTAQTAAIGSTNLSSTPPAGFYEVQVVAICTTASGSGAPTLDVTLAWTDTLGATTEKTINALSLAATGRAHGATRMRVASGNIAYSTTINAASGSPAYALYVRVMALG